MGKQAVYALQCLTGKIDYNWPTTILFTKNTGTVLCTTWFRYTICLYDPCSKNQARPFISVYWRTNIESNNNDL